MTLECEMCAGSKWKSACPECNGTGEIVVNDKIKYWWSEDRKFFCILANDGTSRATVSLTVEEVEELLGEAQQTPSFLKLQEEALQRAQQLMDERGTGNAERDLSEDEVFTLQAAVEHLRGGIPDDAENRERRAEAAWRIASKLEAIAKRAHSQS